MTPLAHRIVKELTLPIKDRTFQDSVGLLKRMSEIHCFEVTEIYPAAEQLIAQMEKAGSLNFTRQLAFLPAPRTWIEWAAKDIVGGYLLEQREGASGAVVMFAGANSRGRFNTSRRSFWLPLSEHEEFGQTTYMQRVGINDSGMEKAWQSATAHIYALLALVNSPRIVGRITRLPHRGLEKALIAKRQSVGHWPLHAWHEIKLSITPPDAAPGEIEEGHLTGKRALHFVRQHLRIRQGRLELVSAHWRGDAQLGIKRARYRVTA